VVDLNEDVKYSKTLSAAVDRAEGIPVVDEDDRPPPPKLKSVPLQGRKRLSGDNVLACGSMSEIVPYSGIFTHEVFTR
jgi:hypothetical protein